MKSKAIAAATKIPLRNRFNTFTILVLMSLLYSIYITFLTPLKHLPC